jgi:hypothetical protein
MRSITGFQETLEAGMNRKKFGLLILILFIAVSPGLAQQATKIGEYSPATAGPSLSSTDATDPSNIQVLDFQATDFQAGAGRTTSQFNRIYVADGSFVRQFNRNNLAAGQLKEFAAPGEVVDIEEGSLLGQIVVLDRTGVHVVDFRTPSPSILGTYPVSSQQSTWGNLVERFGDYLYVTDCSVPGFKILDISDPAAISEILAYPTSVPGGGNSSACATDIRLRNGVVSMVIRSSLELIHVEDFLYPVPVPILAKSVPGLTEIELQNDVAFLADGKRVRIIDIRPASVDFGQEISNFMVGASITALKQRGNRLYVACGEQGYQIWDVSEFSGLGDPPEPPVSDNGLSSPTNDQTLIGYCPQRRIDSELA